MPRRRMTPEEKENIEIQKENDKIIEFIDKYNYPDFDDAKTLIEKDLSVWAEYSELNHELSSIIWKNLLNDKIIKDIGIKINKRGGFKAMLAIHSAITMIARNHLKSSDYIEFYANEILFNIYKTIEQAWDGIGEWSR